MLVVSDKLSNYVVDTDAIYREDEYLAYKWCNKLIIELPEPNIVKDVRIPIYGYDSKVVVYKSNDGVSWSKVTEFWVYHRDGYRNYTLKEIDTKYLRLDLCLGRVGFLHVKNEVYFFLRSLEIVDVSVDRIVRADIPNSAIDLKIRVRNLSSFGGKGYIYLNGSALSVDIGAKSEITTIVEWPVKTGEKTTICVTDGVNKKCVDVLVPFSEVAEVTIEPKVVDSNIWIPYQVVNRSSNYEATVTIKVYVNENEVYKKTVSVSKFSSYSSGIEVKAMAGGTYKIKVCATFDWGVAKGEVCSSEYTIEITAPPEIVPEMLESDVQPRDVNIGEEMKVTATIFNSSTVKGTFTIYCVINGSVIEETRETVEIAPRSTYDYSKTLRFNEAGKYDIKVCVEVM